MSVLKSDPRDWAERMQTNFVDVMIVSDKDLCIELRKSGHDGPMIFHSDEGMYLDQHSSTW